MTHFFIVFIFYGEITLWPISCLTTMFGVKLFVTKLFMANMLRAENTRHVEEKGTDWENDAYFYTKNKK